MSPERRRGARASITPESGRRPGPLDRGWGVTTAQSCLAGRGARPMPWAPAPQPRVGGTRLHCFLRLRPEVRGLGWDSVSGGPCWRTGCCGCKCPGRRRGRRPPGWAPGNAVFPPPPWQGPDLNAGPVPGPGPVQRCQTGGGAPGWGGEAVSSPAAPLSPVAWGGPPRAESAG